MQLTIEYVLTEWDADSRINKTKLDDESLLQARLHSKYSQMLAAIRKELYLAKERRDKLIHEKKLWMNGKMTREEIKEKGWEFDPFNGLSKPLKGEIDEWVKVDDDVSKARDRVNDLEILQDTVKDIVDMIKWRHQGVGNAIDWMKFLSGS